LVRGLINDAKGPGEVARGRIAVVIQVSGARELMKETSGEKEKTIQKCGQG